MRSIAPAPLSPAFRPLLAGLLLCGALLSCRTGGTVVAPPGPESAQLGVRMEEGALAVRAEAFAADSLVAVDAARRRALEQVLSHLDRILEAEIRDVERDKAPAGGGEGAVTDRDIRMARWERTMFLAGLSDEVSAAKEDEAAAQEESLRQDPVFEPVTAYAEPTDLGRIHRGVVHSRLNVELLPERIRRWETLHRLIGGSDLIRGWSGSTL